MLLIEFDTKLSRESTVRWLEEEYRVLYNFYTSGSESNRELLISARRQRGPDGRQ